jgi:hypothetical protein
VIARLPTVTAKNEENSLSCKKLSQNITVSNLNLTDINNMNMEKDKQDINITYDAV